MNGSKQEGQNMIFTIEYLKRKIRKNWKENKKEKMVEETEKIANLRRKKKKVKMNWKGKAKTKKKENR